MGFSCPEPLNFTVPLMCIAYFQPITRAELSTFFGARGSRALIGAHMTLYVVRPAATLPQSWRAKDDNIFDECPHHVPLSSYVGDVMVRDDAISSTPMIS